MTVTNDFNDLVAVITGGASGIGAATAKLLRQRGARVAVLDRDPSPYSNEGLIALECDITDSAAIERAIRKVIETFHGIDIVVNNAGIGAVGDIGANDEEEWHRIFDVNVIGMVRVSRAALPFLKASDNAAMVNTSSVVAAVGVPQRALYSASKGAVSSLTLAMAADHVRDGIRVNAVAPGTADTPWVSRLLASAEHAAEAEEALKARQPLGRLVTADEVAQAIAYLASPLSGSTTGTILAVDGGMSGIRLG